MKIVAIIQARMGSTRLPGKVLMDLAGKPVIQWVTERGRRIEGVDDLLVATTVSTGDDPLVAWCVANAIPVYRGSERDVLGRYVEATQHVGADVVMRITGDCPLLDPRESARVLTAFLNAPGCDYASNIEPPYLPDGLDTEVIRATTLMRLGDEVRDTEYREHVTLHIRRNPSLFTTVGVRGEYDLTHLRWTLDEAEDYELLSIIAEELRHRRQFGYVDDVVRIFEQRPELANLNRHLERNAALRRNDERST